jgi:hypothetical protein
MNEFNLDNDLTKKVNIKSGEVNAKNVYKNFKKQQKKLISDLEEEYDFTEKEKLEIEEVYAQK